MQNDEYLFSTYYKKSFRQLMEKTLETIPEETMKGNQTTEGETDVNI